MDTSVHSQTGLAIFWWRNRRRGGEEEEEGIGKGEAPNSDPGMLIDRVAQRIDRLGSLVSQVGRHVWGR